VPELLGTGFLRRAALVDRVPLFDFGECALGACDAVGGLLRGRHAGPVVLGVGRSRGLVGGFVPDISDVRLGDFGSWLGVDRAEIGGALLHDLREIGLVGDLPAPVCGKLLSAAGREPFLGGGSGIRGLCGARSAGLEPATS
jgi:hypothetical protein